MKRLTFGLLLLAAVAFSPLAGRAEAAGENLQTVVDTLEKSYNSLSDVQADFSQDTTVAAIKRKQHGSGKLYIKKPAMFRFNYRKPDQQIVSNGKKIWFYMAENNQVIMSDASTVFEGGKGVALNYLTGMGHLSRDFTIKLAGSGRDKKGNYVLDLVPKKETQALARLQLTVDAKAVERYREEGKAEAQFPVVSSVVFDPLGNKTVIDFSNIKVNRGIGNDMFTFKVPAGAEVIKQ